MIQKTPIWYMIILMILLVSCRTKPKLDVTHHPMPYQDRTIDEDDEPDANEDNPQEKFSWQNNNTEDFEVRSDLGAETQDFFTGAPPQFQSVDVPEDWGLASTSLSVLEDSDIEEIQEQRWGPIYFAFNQSFIGETERLKLERLAEYLQKNPDLVLVVEGHCDERGSEEFNRSLGEKRALSVQDYLISLGIQESKITTISYGEARLKDSGVNEEAHARNRRAEFIIGISKN